MLFVFGVYNGIQHALIIWIALRVPYKRQEVLTLHEYMSSPMPFCWDPCCSSVFRVILLCFFTFWVPCCDVRYDFRIETMFGSSLSPVVCRRANVLFTLFVFVCAEWCPTHIVLCFYFVFLGLMLPVSLDCSLFWLPLRYSLTFIYVMYMFQFCKRCNWYTIVVNDKICMTHTYMLFMY